MSKIDHRVKEDWRDAFIDPKIRPLIAAMNQPHTGIKTIACCQGHFWPASSPYVYFKCTIQQARAIEARLRDASTHHKWWLGGTFNRDLDLCFVIRAAAPEWATDKGSLFRRFFVYVIQRKRIDEDFALLGELITQKIEYPVKLTRKIGGGEDHDPSDKNQNTKFSNIGFRLPRFSKWIRVFANRARFLWSNIFRKGVVTLSAWKHCHSFFSSNSKTKTPKE